MVKEIDLLNELKTEVKKLEFKQDDKLDACRRRAEMLIRNLFNENSKYIDDLQKISFSSMVWVSGMTDADSIPYWNDGKNEFINLIDTMIEEKTLFQTISHKTQKNEINPSKEPSISEIFIVHGHDSEMKQSIARVIEKLELKAIILHEQPNKGRTLLEKFMDYGSTASFAIVLLSPDDVVNDRNKKELTNQFRARQNVILELGFFIGKLGRSNVIVLYREDENFEMPSDLSGVLYVPFDDQGNWKFRLAKELKVAGYDISADSLL